MEYVKNVCKIGQGSECCRYLIASPKGFECAKRSNLKALLDDRVMAKLINAQGDNCEGLESDKPIPDKIEPKTNTMTDNMMALKDTIETAMAKGYRPYFPPSVSFQYEDTMLMEVERIKSWLREQYGYQISLCSLFSNMYGLYTYEVKGTLYNFSSSVSEPYVSALNGAVNNALTQLK